MKETIALAGLLLFAVSILVLAARKRIGVGMAGALLSCALIAGWVVSHHDGLRTLWIGGTAGREGDLENSDEIGSHFDRNLHGTVAGQLPAGQTVPTLRDILTLLESQQKALDELREITGSVGQKVDVGDLRVKELQESLEQVKREAAALRARSSELALMLTRIIWLQLAAMEEPDADRADAAVQKILDGMDEIVKLAIEDPAARARFVDDVKKALPPGR